MRRVILESPYSGGSGMLAPWRRWLNRRYARRCVRDSLLRGESPLASHLLYAQPGILNDQDVEDRRWGIDAGLAWGQVADATVIYVDRGVSSGMSHGIARARAEGRPVEHRTLEAIASCPHHHDWDECPVCSH